MLFDLLADLSFGFGAWFLLGAATFQLLAVFRAFRAPDGVPLDGALVLATTGTITALVSGQVFFDIITRRFG